MTYKQIQIHIWSVFVPILQSWKLRHSEDTPGTLYSKQAPQHRRCSVIINTMTMWVYTKCCSGKRLLSGETASLFLRLAHSFTWFTDDNAAVGVWLSVRETRVLWWIRGELSKYLLYLWRCFPDELPEKLWGEKWHSVTFKTFNEPLCSFLKNTPLLTSYSFPRLIYSLVCLVPHMYNSHYTEL